MVNILGGTFFGLIIGGLFAPASHPICDLIMAGGALLGLTVGCVRNSFKIRKPPTDSTPTDPLMD